MGEMRRLDVWNVCRAESIDWSFWISLGSFAIPKAASCAYD